MKNSLISNNEDLAGFNHLYEKYFDVLLSYCNSYVHSVPIAKDIVQDSFISLWENRKKLSSNTHYRNYLFVLVRNKSLNYLKHLKVEAKYVNNENIECLKSEINTIALEYDAHDLLLVDELNEMINESIEELPEKCKLIFELSRKEEKKNKEIAKELSISIKTVEAQITKGLKLLRKKLDHYFD